MKNKISKTVSLILASLMLLVCFSSCRNEIKPGDVSTNSEKPKVKMNVSVMKGPTAIGMMGLMRQDKNEAAKNDYDFQMFTAPDQAVAAVVNKSVDIAAVPTNLAATLYKKTNGGVSVIAATTTGVLHILTKDQNVKTIADLKGKKLYATGQGATNEYVLNFLLEKNGLVLGKDIEVIYKAEHSELASLMLTGEAEYALLPDPFATTVTNKNKDIKKVIDLANAWESVPENNNNNLIMGCLIVRNEYLEQNPEAVKTFLLEYSASVQALQLLDETLDNAEEFEIISRDAVIPVIPSCVYYTGDKMKNAISSYLDILFKSNPASVGGSLPDDAFYYSAK